MGIHRKGPKRTDCPEDCRCMACMSAKRLKLEADFGECEDLNVVGFLLEHEAMGLDYISSGHQEAKPPTSQETFCPCGKLTSIWSGRFEMGFCSDACLERKHKDPSWGKDLRWASAETSLDVVDYLTADF